MTVAVLTAGPMEGPPATTPTGGDLRRTAFPGARDTPGNGVLRFGEFRVRRVTPMPAGRGVTRSADVEAIALPEGHSNGELIQVDDFVVPHGRNGHVQTH